MKRNIQVALVTLLVLLVAVFALQNTEIVQVRLLWLELSMSRAILVILLLLIGFVGGWITRAWPRTRADHQERL